MSYYSYGRLKFCYQLFAFLSIVLAIAFMIMTLYNYSILYAFGSAILILVCAGCVKRAEMYQTKMDNWSYKNYLDKLDE